MLDPKNLKNGEEQFEDYWSRVTHRAYVQYDYRHTNGEFFSCIANNEEEAREKRDKWISKNNY